MSSQKNATSIRICHLIDVYPPSIGGSETQSYALAENLIKKGLKFFVITRRIFSDSKRFEYLGKVPVQRITPGGKYRGKGWKAFIPISFLVTKIFFLLIKNINRYDIILVSSVKVLSIPAIIIKSMFNKKCVILDASPDELGQDVISDESLRMMRISRSSILFKIIRSIRNFLLKKTDCFVVFSPEMAQQIINIGFDPNKVRTIPTGVDTNKFIPVSYEKKIMIRSKLSLPIDKIIFIFTGRITKSKGVILLVEVWKEILKKYNNIYLVLIGSGKNSFDNCEDEVNQYIVDNNLGQSILVAGIVDQVNGYLQAADVFVLPSYYEGFSLSTLEALASGLPSILTGVGVNAEIINNKENGINIEPQNREELYNGIEWMLEHRNLWETIGKNARTSIEKYSIEEEADKFIEMFSELFEKKAFPVTNYLIRKEDE